MPKAAECDGSREEWIRFICVTSAWRLIKLLTTIYQTRCLFHVFKARNESGPQQTRTNGTYLSRFFSVCFYFFCYLFKGRKAGLQRVCTGRNLMDKLGLGTRNQKEELRERRVER